MGDGFTGIDLRQAAIDMNNLNYVFKGFCEYLEKYNETLIVELAHNWASPNAVTFNNKYAPVFIDMYKETVTTLNKLTIDVADAIASMASANGATFDTSSIDTTDKLINGTATYEGQAREQDDNGATGMNVEACKTILEEYNTNINSLLNKMDEFPTSLALYDPDGNLQSSYKSRMSTLKESLNSKISEVNKTINNSMETEQNNILLSVTTASDTLRSASDLPEGFSFTEDYGVTSSEIGNEHSAVSSTDGAAYTPVNDHTELINGPVDSQTFVNDTIDETSEIVGKAMGKKVSVSIATDASTNITNADSHTPTTDTFLSESSSTYFGSFGIDSNGLGN